MEDEMTDLDELLGSVDPEDSPTQEDPKPSEAPKAEKPKGKPGRKPRAESSPPPAAVAEVPKATFIVAKGKSISTKSRGIVDAGKQVFVDDFSEGEKRLEELVLAGYLTKS